MGNYLSQLSINSNTKNIESNKKEEDDYNISYIESNKKEEDYNNISYIDNRKYKIINIQTLGNVEQYKGYKYHSIDKKEYLENINCPKNRPNQILYYEDNVYDENHVLYHQNNFVGAFLSAYNYHANIVLNPDDIWIQICLFFSNYVDKNSEKLRHLFVSHEGKMCLTVVEEEPNSITDAILLEKRWDNFFTQIKEQIRNNVLNEIVDELECDFSTSEKFHKIISTSIIMNSCKKYFEYVRLIPMCGIENIYFMGNRNDWIKIITKINALKKYDVDGILITYIKKMNIILLKFLNTYDNNIDVSFWNSIMTLENERRGSGSTTNIEGWITHFYGIYKRISIDEFPSSMTEVPIKLINKMTGIDKDLKLTNDWCCISKINEKTYKPSLSIKIRDITKYGKNFNEK